MMFEDKISIDRIWMLEYSQNQKITWKKGLEITIFCLHNIDFDFLFLDGCCGGDSLSMNTASLMV